MATYDSNLDWLVPDDMNVYDVEKRREIGAAIRSIYTGGATLVEHAIPSVRVSRRIIKCNKNQNVTSITVTTRLRDLLGNKLNFSRNSVMSTSTNFPMTAN
jgi:hypothetical protein